jgi:hypothetical protein
VAGGTHAGALGRSPTWHLFIGIWGRAASAADQNEESRIRASAAKTYERVTARFNEIFEGMALLLGRRFREGYDVRLFSLAVQSLSEGCALRDRIDPSSTRGILRPTGPNGEPEEWTLFSVGFESLARQFTEWDTDPVDPDHP